MNFSRFLFLLIAVQLALSLSSAVTSKAQSDEGALLAERSLALYRAGKFADAVALAEQVLAIRERTAGPDHPDLATAMHNLAVLYLNQARDVEAERLYRKALVIREKALGSDHPDVAQTLNNLAVLFAARRNDTDAEPLYRRSLQIREKALGPDHLDVAQSLHNLAALYGRKHRYDEAEQLYNRALAIRRKTLGPGDILVAKTLHSLGEVYRGKRDTNDAELLLNEALEIYKKAVGFEHPDVAGVLTSLGTFYRSQRRYTEAEKYLKQALAVRETLLGSDHVRTTQSLTMLAVFYDSRGRSNEALPLIRQTIGKRFSEKRGIYRIFDRSLRQKLVTVPEAFDATYETVQHASLSAAGNAISRLAARFAAGTGELAQYVREDQDLAAESEQLDAAILTGASKSSADRDVSAEDNMRKRIDEIKLRREGLKAIFDQRFPDYVALSRTQTLSLQETQSLLANDEAVIVFDFAAESYAWLITRNSFEWKQLRISDHELRSSVERLRESLTDEISDPLDTTKISDLTPFDVTHAYAIYRATFGQFSKQIDAKKRISVVTNGALTGLPPHVLVTKDPEGKSLKDVDWFVRTHAITILPSVASLRVLRARSSVSPANKPMIAFADPVFSKIKGESNQQRLSTATKNSITRAYRGTQLDAAALIGSLPPLPGTRTEVNAIAKILRTKSTDINLGTAATEMAVKRAALDQYRIVYFATHGLVSGDIEEFAKTRAEPALAFSVPDEPTELDDGLLQASEIAQLKLNADWVVLSACNTAAENAPGAEALSGLARAFFYAGARSLIVSHWEVDDRATAQLMINTFRTAAANPDLSHAQALRIAMLKLLDNSKSGIFAHPRFWAPFVVVGEPARRAR